MKANKTAAAASKIPVDFQFIEASFRRGIGAKQIGSQD
jgi:hypothetical protein